MSKQADEGLESLIQDLGDFCHEYYQGCTQDEYAYSAEVINLLAKPGAKNIITEYIQANYAPNHLVEQRCLESRIDQLKNVTLKALLGSGEPESIAIILEQIDSLEAQLTNLQNKEEK